MKLTIEVDITVPVRTEPAAVQHWIEKTLKADSGGSFYRVNSVQVRHELVSEAERQMSSGGS